MLIGRSDGRAASLPEARREREASLTQAKEGDGEGARPRVGLFLFECGDAETVRRTVESIPEAVHGALDEVVVMDDRLGTEALPELAEAETLRKLDVVVHRNPREHGFGAARKAAFEYARLKHFDWALCMRAGVGQPATALEALLECVGEAAADAPQALLLATRGAPPAGRSAGSRLRGLARALWVGLLNRVLGLRLSDYGTSFRAVPASILSRIPTSL